MPTIPTQYLETELRKLYLQWVSGLSVDDDNVASKINDFQRRSEALISRMGGQVARLGAVADFPAPKRLELSPYAGKVYDQMQQAAIQAGIMTGISSKETARVMFRAGMDKSYRRLERLARTETTSAYWKNAFDSVADLPNIVMLWGSEDGPRTCAWCRERDGLVMDSPNLRDHPNGRCTPIPTLRSAVQYRGSISPDNRIYFDPDWNKATPSKSVTPQPQPVQEVEVILDTVSYSDADIQRGLSAAERQRQAMQSFQYDKKGNLNVAAGWDNEARQAWNSYTSGGYVDINQSFRNPTAFAEAFEGDDFWKDKFLAEGSKLQELMGKNVLSEDIMVARGLTSTTAFDPATLKVGQSFSDPGFWSTSSKLDEAAEFVKGNTGASSQGGQGWLFLSKAPKGTPAIPGVAGQGEIIFQPEQMQKIVGIDYDKHIVYLEMKP